ncbi:general odorant-binding protein 56a [Drosophila ficusphila]|uniref:general odorant-binding protein 56a n=1 Tax=Drosophila ficusphila TaxID=30025 RepID=UPI0007E89DD4|nr:general odorant-binding protein 56a [Drosophila ficusphila]
MRATLSLTLLLSFIAGILSQEGLDSQISVALVEGCIKENGVTEQELADLKSGKVKPMDAKDNIKCSTQCIMAKSGFMDSKGNLMTDKIKAHYANTNLKDDLEKALEKCSKVTGDNACDKAYKIMACFAGH